MGQINISNLTFGYEGGYENVFENVSFSIDSNWKLGLIGRNGKGKTTLFKLLMGKYEYQGKISTETVFDYFPYNIEEEDKDSITIDLVEKLQPDYELWMLCRELDLLKVDAEILYRQYNTLSHGERTKVMLALLFARDNYFLLIDEPTNHLDLDTRKVLIEFLRKKKSYILISHDRWFMDQCVDHVLVINRTSIQVEKGNFSSWWENKTKKDAYELAENKKISSEVKRLEASAKRTSEWADKAEKTKIGFDPIKEHDRSGGTRPYIASKTKSMQKRRKDIENKQKRAIEEKRGLLKDIEKNVNLKLMPLDFHKERYVYIDKFSFGFDEHLPIFTDFNMEIRRGDRIALRGENGCGKSTIIKRILGEIPEDSYSNGTFEVAKGLIISYINQDTSILKGKLKHYIDSQGLDESVFKAILRQLDMNRIQFDMNMEDYSEGQRKKVLIAGSSLKQAHLYIWDEPLNYIDVFSRMQIENLILEFMPTMLLVEHDKVFTDKIASKIVEF